MFLHRFYFFIFNPDFRQIIKMKTACIILTVLILVAIMAVCVMVKFATDITLHERKRELVAPGGGIFHLSKSMGVFALNDNTSLATAQRFPYMAAIIRNSSSTWSFACFASIILVKWVVTSAHCKKHGAIHKVLLYHDFSRNATTTYPILFWRLHEKFNISNPTAKFDIAVAKLNIQMNPYLVKSSIFDEGQVDGSMEASVWKTVWAMDRKMYLTNDLDKISVKIAKIGRCFESYAVDFDESLLCVDLSDHNHCFINEFGPIYSEDRILGILAVKPRDCDLKLAIFTNISFYASWLLKSTHNTYYG